MLEIHESVDENVSVKLNPGDMNFDPLNYIEGKSDT